MTNTATTYTIIDGEGYVIERSVSLTEAAHAIMTSDSREWEIRKDAQLVGYTAWTRQQVANRPWTQTVFYSSHTNYDDAQAEISELIVSAPRMIGHCEAITDAAYDEMMADILAEDEDN